MANFNSNTRHSLTDKKSGKFVSKKTPWTLPGYAGFAAWMEQIKPRILHADGTYRVFKPEGWQLDVLKEILRLDQNGNPQYNFILLTWPKRHSKLVLHNLLCLHSLCSKKNWLAVCLANKLEQTLSVNYRMLVDTIRNTPSLRTLIGLKNIKSTEISFPKNNNRIIAMANKVSGAHGMKLSTLWVTELWQNPDLKAYRALQASLADTTGGVCYCDTNTDYTGGIIEQMELDAKSNPYMFAHRIEYKDFEEFEAKAPSWISRAAVSVSRNIDLSQDWDRNWLNKRSSSKSNLISDKLIKQAKEKYHCPVEDVKRISQGRKYIITGGLDRAKNLLPGVSKSDYTVWTSLMKVADPTSGDSHYHILNQVRFKINSDKNIKKAILTDNKKYGLTNTVLEHYEVTGISAFLDEEKITHELVSPTSTLLQFIFSEMSRIFRDGRFHFSEDLTDFEKELKTFTVTQGKGNRYVFGSSSQKLFDDTVLSVAHAIYAGRKHVLNIYEIGNIQCVNKSVKRILCYMLNSESNMELLCSENCLAAQQVKIKYEQFKQFQPGTKLTLPEFYHAYCRRTGALIQQAA